MRIDIKPKERVLGTEVEAAFSGRPGKSMALNGILGKMGGFRGGWVVRPKRVG
jgi:hypothetical protein